MMIKVSTQWVTNADQIQHKFTQPDFTKLSQKDQLKEAWKILTDSSLSGEEIHRVMSVIKNIVSNSVWQSTLTDEEIYAMSPQELELYWEVSKRKIALTKLKIYIDKHYESLTEIEKEDLAKSWVWKEEYIAKKVRETFLSLKGFSQEIVGNLKDKYSLAPEVYQFLTVFNSYSDYQDDITEMAQDEWISPLVFANIWSTLPFTKINSAKIVKEATFWVSEVDAITWNFLSKDKLWETEEDIDGRNGFINPNWFLYDMDIETAVKLWGVEKAKYIFWDYFRESIEESGLGGSITMPEFYNLCVFRLKVNEDAEWNKKKLIDLGQHIFEWNIDESFTNEQFTKLAAGLKTVVSDFKGSGTPKKFEHPVHTSMWSKNYSWYFSGSKWFENTHLVEITPTEKKGQRVLRFATEMWQDELLFITTQISYFLKNGKVLETRELWREIYGVYNKLSLEGTEIFPSSTMKEQYDTLVKKVVWPLSKEHKEKKGRIWKSHNSVLYWVYGTGKSQLLTHLISESKYELPNWEKINLEAVVINISVMEFADLLVKSSSEFRKRLSDIHENTWKPIILVIEDIDTIIKEEGMQSDPISQAMTTMFEWVGSLPLTVITSTNNPEILPQRHLRPNRFDVPIWFNYPLSPELLWSILKVHLERNGLIESFKNYFSSEQLHDLIINRIIHYTPSNVAALCLSIYEDIEFEDLEFLWIEWVKKLIEVSLSNQLVPAKDMKAKQESMQKWRDSLSDNGGNIGFVLGNK